MEPRRLDSRERASATGGSETGRALVIEPVLQKVKTGPVNADDIQKMVLFAVAQNRKKSIEEIAAE